MQESREQKAISAYIALLKSKKVDKANIKLRQGILNDLSPMLTGKVLDGAGYRIVIEEFIERAPADAWPLVLATAREYFHFWMDDIDSIVTMNSNEGFKRDGWAPDPVTIEQLTEELKIQKFDSAEIWPLKAYKQALKNAGAGEALVDARAKLAKIALLRLRSSPVKNHQSYRVVVDSTLPLFRIKNSRKLFLEVVREFYYFWSGNPDAESHVLQAG